MLSVIQSRRYIFKHNLNSTLLSAVAISGRRCVLFYSNSKYLEYDPYSKKVLSEGTLPCKPYKTLLLTKQLILCLLENQKLCRLSFEKGNMDIGCELPHIKTDSSFTDRQMVLDCEIGVLIDSGIYFITLLYKNENKRRILYFPDPYSFEYNSYEFHSIESVCEKLDEVSKLAIYFQHVEEEVEWEIKIIDLVEGTDRRIVVYNQLLKHGSIVQKIIMKNQNQLYFFINGEHPTILLFQISSQGMYQVKFTLLPNLLDVVFYNPLKNTVCLSFLQHIKLNGEITDTVLEIVDLGRLKTLSKVNVCLKDVSLPIENDYILDIAAEGKQGNSTIFHARHLIKKRAMIFHLMKMSGVFDMFGSTAIRKVLSLFDI